MRDFGNGVFYIEPGDWGHVMTWPTPPNEVPLHWEKPLLIPAIAYWFLQRHFRPFTVTIDLESSVKTIQILDSNLAFEFRLRWCIPRDDAERRYDAMCAGDLGCAR